MHTFYKFFLFVLLNFSINISFAQNDSQHYFYKNIHINEYNSSEPFIYFSAEYFLINQKKAIFHFESLSLHDEIVKFNNPKLAKIHLVEKSSLSPNTYVYDFSGELQTKFMDNGVAINFIIYKYELDPNLKFNIRKFTNSIYSISDANIINLNNGDYIKWFLKKCNNLIDCSINIE